MNKKYERYINYIIEDIKPPYFINMKDNYGLKPEEYELVLSKVYNEPVNIKGDYVYDTNGNTIYYEDSTVFWYKREYDFKGNNLYSENSNGFWVKREFDQYDNNIYYEDSNGKWIKKEYDINDNEIYYEDSDGYIEDNR